MTRYSRMLDKEKVIYLRGIPKFTNGKVIVLNHTRVRIDCTRIKSREIVTIDFEFPLTDMTARYVDLISILLMSEDKFFMIDSSKGVPQNFWMRLRKELVNISMRQCHKSMKILQINCDMNLLEELCLVTYHNELILEPFPKIQNEFYRSDKMILHPANKLYPEHNCVKALLLPIMILIVSKPIKDIKISDFYKISCLSEIPPNYLATMKISKYE